MQEQTNVWTPPTEITRKQAIALSQETLRKTDIPIAGREDIFRLRVLEMDWDIGTMTYAPEDPGRIPVGPDGKKAGIFLLHGGTSDYKSLEPVATMLAGKFGFKVALMTFLRSKAASGLSRLPPGYHPASFEMGRVNRDGPETSSD